MMIFQESLYVGRKKAFCAGGDIVSVYHTKNDPKSTLSHDFLKKNTSLI